MAKYEVGQRHVNAAKRGQSAKVGNAGDNSNVDHLSSCALMAGVSEGPEKRYACTAAHRQLSTLYFALTDSNGLLPYVPATGILSP
jgi:hypothetical protein